MKYIAVIALYWLGIQWCSATVKPYTWEKDRSRYVLTETEKVYAELILKHHIQYDYALEGDDFIMYATVHNITLANNDEAIQKNNRIVISMGNTLELVELKARAINKDGKVVYFDKSNLKELKEEEGGKSYKIFAVEGIELGSEIEYFYTKKMNATLFDRTFLQFEVPIRTCSFLLTCPDHLKFDFKSYQNVPDVTFEKHDEQHLYSVSLTDVIAIKDEPFSYQDANRKRIEYKLAYNTARSNARMYTWDDAGKTFYRILTTTTKEEEKAIDKFIKTLQDNPKNTLAPRIKNIENQIKTTIRVDDKNNDPSLKNMEDILKVKVASENGITKLFFVIFNKLNIACYPVLTCDREKVKFDGSFDSWGFLDDYLLYFPELKEFISPSSPETRYPLVPSEFTAQQGLFIEPLSLGTVKSALASVQFIPAASYTVNTDNMSIEITFNADLSANTIHQLREFGGYNATTFLRYYDLMTTEQRANMAENLVKQIAPDATITEWKAKKLEKEKDGSFLFDINFNSAHFIEKAGSKILFKAGELIGTQVEMYRDDKRTSPVENYYNRSYERKIVVQLPAGYHVKNAQDLKINIAALKDDATPYSFQSDYTLKGSTLEITINEYYKEIYAPLDQYESFRKVVNAAADFNKITLVLEKL